MKSISPELLSEALRRGEKKRFYYITGDDEYLIERCVRDISRASEGDERLRFDALNFDSERFEEAVVSFPFLAGRTVIIENFKTRSLSAETAALFEELLRDIPDYLTVIMTSYSDARVSVSKQAQKLAALSGSSEIVIAAAPDVSRAGKIVAGMAKDEGAGITPRAARLLLSLVGNDLQTAKMEIKKLAALARYTTIEEQHVQRLTAKSTESSVIDMLRALERSNVTAALLVLREMLGDRTDPLAITATLNTAYINLYRAKLAAAKGVGINGLFALFDYIKDDRKVSIAVNRQRGYTFERLEAVLELLYQLDLDLKSSPADRALLMEQAVIELSAR